MKIKSIALFLILIAVSCVWAETKTKSQSKTKSKMINVDVNKWGLDSERPFEITNHLIGYSVIQESDNSYQGVKVTSLVNFGYYVPTQNNVGNQKKERFVFGYETPNYELTKDSDLFFGLGIAFGEATALYVDLGLEFTFLRWLKAQLGMNYNFAHQLSPQMSLGFTW